MVKVLNIKEGSVSDIKCFTGEVGGEQFEFWLAGTLHGKRVYAEDTGQYYPTEDSIDIKSYIESL